MLSSKATDPRWNSYIASANKAELQRLQEHVLWQAFDDARMKKGKLRKVLHEYWHPLFICGEIAYLSCVVTFASHPAMQFAAVLLGMVFAAGAAFKLDS